eukprot:scaffold92934_cov27-Phaeocystis_antarctica.AAC.1
MKPPPSFESLEDSALEASALESLEASALESLEASALQSLRSWCALTRAFRRASTQWASFGCACRP